MTSRLTQLSGTKAILSLDYGNGEVERVAVKNKKIKPTFHHASKFTKNNVEKLREKNNV